MRYEPRVLWLPIIILGPMWSVAYSCCPGGRPLIDGAKYEKLSWTLPILQWGGSVCQPSEAVVGCLLQKVFHNR